VDFLGRKLGADNEAIYCGELGISKAKLRQLKDAGIV